jgi:hypothetical protein
MRRGTGGLSIALLALLAPGCGAPDDRRPAAPAAAASSAAKSGARAPYETPARWSAHPSPSYASSSMRLADGSCLVVEYTGQRWITRPHRDNPVDVSSEVVLEGDEQEAEPAPAPEAFGAEPGTSCSGDGRPALEKAPEPVTGIVLLSGAYGFVGEGGTIHVARSPLGRFTRRIYPPEPLSAARSTGGAVLAITPTGRLLRWTEQTGYQRVETDGLHAIDLDAAPSGRAVVLTAPEALFTTEDAGLHVARAQAPSIGAQRVKHEPGGPFLVEGVETTLAWDPREPPSFAKTSMRIQSAAAYVTIDAGRSARAGMVTEQRGALDGDRYWEVSQEGGNFSLYKGKMDGRIALAGSIADANDTQSVMIAARDRHAAIVVYHWDDMRSIELRTSHDGGASFGHAADLVTSDGAPLGLAVSAEGTVLLTGTCIRDPDAEGQSCEGKPLVLRPEAPIEEPRTPPLAGSAFVPAFSADGRHAYFLASGDNEDPMSLYVSKDGGVSFEERALRIDRGRQKVTFDMASDTAITVSERGTVGMVMSGRGEIASTVYVTTDADGRHLQAGEPPSGNVSLGGFGERVIAVSLSRSRGSSSEGSPVWESLDGGLHWNEVPAPQSLRDGYYRHGEIACSAAGCLVGDDVTRIGWGGTPREPLPFEPVEPEEPPKALRVPIVCDPRPGSAWTRIDNASDPGMFPDESDAARGRSAWMTTTLDPETGAISVVTAEIPDGGGEPRLVTKQLLGPIPKKEKWALSYHPQIEGVAVARLKLTPDIADAPWGSFEGKPLKNLEVGWENQEEGSSTHMTLADAGTMQRYAIQPKAGRYANLLLGTLSVSPKGIFVRGSESDKIAYLADTSGKAHPFRFPEDPSLPAGTLRLDDAVNVDGTYIADGLYNPAVPNAPQTLVLLRPPAPDSAPGTPWTPWAQTVAPGTDPRHQRTTRFNWTYQGGHLTVFTTHVVPASGYAVSWLQRVQADGTLTPPARAATPYDLGRTPRACTAAEHKDLARLRFTSVRQGVLEFVGTQHPVLVRGIEPRPGEVSADDAASGGPLAMLSSGVVMRGTPASACVDAFGARGMGADWNRVAVIAGDLAHGWLFRPAGDRVVPGKGAKKPSPDETGSHDIEVRPLACHYDTTVPLPTVFDMYREASESARETGAKSKR